MNNYCYLTILIFIILFIFHIYINNYNIELFELLPETKIGPIKFVDFNNNDIELGRYPPGWKDDDLGKYKLNPTIIKIKKGPKGEQGPRGTSAAPEKCQDNVNINTLTGDSLTIGSNELNIMSNKINFKNKLCFGKDDSACIDEKLIDKINNNKEIENLRDECINSIRDGNYVSITKYNQVKDERDTAKRNYDMKKGEAETCINERKDNTKWVSRDECNKEKTSLREPLDLQIETLTNIKNNFDQNIKDRKLIKKEDIIWEDVPDNVKNNYGKKGTRIGEYGEIGIDNNKYGKIGDTSGYYGLIGTKKGKYGKIGDDSDNYLKRSECNSKLQDKNNDIRQRYVLKGQAEFDDLKSNIQTSYGKIGTSNGEYGKIGNAGDNYLKRSECKWNIAADKSNYGLIGTDNGNYGKIGNNYPDYGLIGVNPGNYGLIGVNPGNYGLIGVNPGNYGKIGANDSEYFKRNECDYKYLKQTKNENICKKNNQITSYNFDNENLNINSNNDECVNINLFKNLHSKYISLKNKKDLSNINRINSGRNPLYIDGEEILFNTDEAIFNRLCFENADRDRQCLNIDTIKKMNEQPCGPQGPPGTCDDNRALLN